MHDVQDSEEVGESGAEGKELGAQPVILSPRHVAALGDQAEPVLERPVLEPEPVQLGREVLQVPLLPPPGPASRLAVRFHSAALPLVHRVDRPARALLPGVVAGRAVVVMEEGKEVIDGQTGFENRTLELDRFVGEEHGWLGKKKRKGKEPGWVLRSEPEEREEGEKGRNEELGVGIYT